MAASAGEKNLRKMRIHTHQMMIEKTRIIKPSSNQEKAHKSPCLTGEERYVGFALDGARGGSASVRLELCAKVKANTSCSPPSDFCSKSQTDA